MSADDEAWKIMSSLRADLVKVLKHVCKAPQEVAEDCASEAIIQVAADWDGVQIATEANASHLKLETVAFSRMRREAERVLNREKRHTGRMVSDDTPLGDDPETNFTLKDICVPKINTVAHIEAYCECMMFLRKGRSHLSEDEIEMLFGIAEGVEPENRQVSEARARVLAKLAEYRKEEVKAARRVARQQIVIREAAE